MVYADRGGVDAQFGMPFEPVTPEIARNLERASADTHAPRRIPPAMLRETTYFEPVTREPRVWYAVNPRGDIDGLIVQAAAREVQQLKDRL